MGIRFTDRGYGMRWKRSGNVYTTESGGWSVGIIDVGGTFHIRMIRNGWVIQTVKCSLVEAKKASTRMIKKLTGGTAHGI